MNEKFNIIQKDYKGIAEFLVNGFPFLGIDEAQRLCKWWPLKLVVSNSRNKIVGLAMYMMINDEALEIIEDNLRYMSDPRRFTEIANMPGDNLHIFCLHTRGVKYIIYGIKMLLTKVNCSTLSWINKDMSNITIIEGERLCHKRL